MPLTPAGRKTLAAYRRQYGARRGEEYFYASINSGRLKGMERRARRAKRAKK